MLPQEAMNAEMQAMREQMQAQMEAQKAERLVGDYFKKGYKNVINNVTGKGTVFENYLN